MLFSMKKSTKATTIKLDGELLEELERNKPKGTSVTSYVKAAVRKSLNETCLRESAAEYIAMTEADPAEKALFDEWQSADLSSPVKKKVSSKKSRS